MKIAVSGKGGAGKSTLAAMLCRLAAEDGKRVLAVDADPDANLAFALGIPPQELSAIIPLSQRKELIEERTGAKLKQFGQIFKLNPQVNDIADKFAYNFHNINLLVLGAIASGGSGCACPENVFLKSLLSEIILYRNEFVIVDFEAGLEHLGRATAKSVDLMLAVTEPSPQSVATVKSIKRLCQDIGLASVKYVGNKIISPDDEIYLQTELEADNIVGFIPYDKKILDLERKGIPLFDGIDVNLRDVFHKIFKRMLKAAG